MKIVIIGSSTGIGKAIAENLLSLKHEIWGVARREQLELQQKYPSLFFSTQADAADWKQMEVLREKIKKKWNMIDALIICAGFQGAIGSLSTLHPEQWSNTVMENINLTFFPLRILSELLARANNPSKVICFSGGGATQARPYFSAYAVAKTGIVRLVETLAEEWKNNSVEINAVAPGRINTSMMDEIIAKGPALAGAQEYAGALKQKENRQDSLPSVLALIRWLLSPQSNGITGKLISAQWDQWEKWSEHLDELQTTDIYTLRRITGRERSVTWGDKK